jgi:hypothetical protein
MRDYFCDGRSLEPGGPGRTYTHESGYIDGPFYEAGDGGAWRWRWVWQGAYHVHPNDDDKTVLVRERWFRVMEVEL